MIFQNINRIIININCLTNYVRIKYLFNIFKCILDIEDSQRITNLIILGNYYKYPYNLIIGDD